MSFKLQLVRLLSYVCLVAAVIGAGISLTLTIIQAFDKPSDPGGAKLLTPTAPAPAASLSRRSFLGRGLSLSLGSGTGEEEEEGTGFSSFSFSGFGAAAAERGRVATALLAALDGDSSASSHDSPGSSSSSSSSSSTAAAAEEDDARRGGGWLGLAAVGLASPPPSAALQDVDACQLAPLNNSRPFRVVVPNKAQADQPGTELYCGWPPELEWARVIAGTLSLATAPLVLWFGLWQSRRWVVWCGAGAGLVLAMGWFGCMVFDSARVAAAKKWCDDYAVPRGWACQPAPFQTTCFVDAGLCAGWAALTAFLFILARHGEFDHNAARPPLPAALGGSGSGGASYKQVVASGTGDDDDDLERSLAADAARADAARAAAASDGSSATPSGGGGGSGGGDGGLLTTHRTTPAAASSSTSGAESYESVLQRQFEEARLAAESERDQYTALG